MNKKKFLPGLYFLPKVPSIYRTNCDESMLLWFFVFKLTKLVICNRLLVRILNLSCINDIENKSYRNLLHPQFSFYTQKKKLKAYFQMNQKLSSNCV